MSNVKFQIIGNWKGLVRSREVEIGNSSEGGYVAHKKGGGAVGKNRDSSGKRLGVKITAGQKALPGNIIARQRGTKIYAGAGTMLSRDHTIFAISSGIVQFKQRLGKKLVEVIGS